MNTQVLEKYRAESNLTITELSKRMGRTPGWYSRIKDGKKDLPSRYIVPLAELFGVRADRLASELYCAHELEHDSSYDDGVIFSGNSKMTTEESNETGD